MGHIGLAILAGHCWLHSLSELPDGQPWSFVLVLAILAALLLRARLLAFALLGFAWAWGHAAARIAEDLPTTLEGLDLQVRGHVASIPDARQDTQFTLEVAEPTDVPRRIRLSWYQAEARPRAGEPWQLIVRLKRRHGLANPGGFDYEAFLFREEVGATGYVRNDPRNLRLGPPSVRYAVLRARAWLGHRIELAVPDSEMVGILQGLAIGDTQAMTARQWRTLAATGTTHLMAISGLHISMLAALAAWLGGGIVRWPSAQARGWAARHGQVAAGTVAALAYSTLAGLSLPTQRTLIMLCMYFAARASRRTFAPTHALGLALVGVLLIDPFAPLAVGAWLSFGAVAIILLAVSGRVGRDGVVNGFVRVQWAITIGLTPILLVAFGALSVVSPLANALAVPLFTLVIVPIVLLGTAVAALTVSAGGWILALAVGVLEASWPVFEWLASHTGAYSYLPQLPPTLMVALATGVTLLVLPGIHATRLAGLLLCLPTLLYRPASPPSGEFAITLLDVGQGLSVVVRTQRHVLVYDAGPAFRTGRDTGELAVLPYVRSLGLRSIDLLIVSHDDLDHRGGARSVLEAMPVERRLLGPSVMLQGERCRRGQRWHWDGVSFDVLHPTTRVDVRDNDSSCVVRIAGRSGTALLTGDVQSAAEVELLRGSVAPTDIVVVPHHGSRTSSSPEFVDALAPSVALISAGYRNRWNLPSPDVVARWKEQGARAYVTAESGALEVYFEDGAVRVREYRRESRRYWRRKAPPP